MLAGAVFSAVLDFYLAMYPSIILARLNMGWRKKLGLAFALGFGYWWVTTRITCLRCPH